MQAGLAAVFYGLNSSHDSARTSRARKPGWTVYRPGPLARNTVIILAGLGLRTLLQGILFILIARSLGAPGYGEFMAALALVTPFAPFAGLGVRALMVREVSRKPDVFSREFGRGLVLVSLTSFPLVSLVTLAGAWFLGPEVSPKVLLFVALAELIFVPLVELAACGFQAFERMARMALIFNGLIFFRLVAFFFMPLWSQSVNPDAWAACYMVASALFAGCAVLIASMELGPPHWDFDRKWKTMREGLFFALSGASIRTQAEIDKALVARLEGSNAAGIYSAGYRFVDMALLPIQALLAASLARFFRAGEEGMAISVRYALRLLPLPGVYAGAASVGLFFLSGVLPWLLGPSFTEAVDVVRWLALLPFLMLLRYFLAAVAEASGCQRLSGIAHGLGAASSVVLNLLWIPLWSWKGAALAAYATQVIVILLLSIGVARNSSTIRERAKTAGTS